ncbi:hypothetical protein H2204_015214 [Knufia peltigerae]|uniref:Alpha/beta hydrolase fold-3 domain-containing protein n=1 Tax=Knufia peltigerae TaxID=1002370 RepID=A0AA38XE31_9EURO|nr:hypothetical protein H2204_015214 [Knufia peltigerae]
MASKPSQRSKADLYNPDPNWTAFAEKNGYQSPASPFVLDVEGDRAAEVIREAEFTKQYPLSSFGYNSVLTNVTVRDGASISVKISYPKFLAAESDKKQKLPVLFVTHGGSWIQGSHTTEEAWFLWPLYEHFNFLIVSVEYRLAPEHAFPVWMDDSWDVLEQLLSSPEKFFSSAVTTGSGSGDSAAGLKNVHPDLGRVILAGSSAGGGTAAYLSQTCRDRGFSVYGVILNIPLVCDYRHLPVDCRLSYEQATTNSRLCSGEMRASWDLVRPVTPTQKIDDPKASPLLCNLKGLPKHLVFVAGHDPLRDEALKYVEILEDEGVDVQLFTYPGVPHGFAAYWELDASKKFAEDLRRGLKGWIG